MLNTYKKIVWCMYILTMSKWLQFLGVSHLGRMCGEKTNTEKSANSSFTTFTLWFSQGNKIGLLPVAGWSSFTQVQRWRSSWWWQRTTKMCFYKRRTWSNKNGKDGCYISMMHAWYQEKVKLAGWNMCGENEVVMVSSLL